MSKITGNTVIDITKKFKEKIGTAGLNTPIAHATLTLVIGTLLVTPELQDQLNQLLEDGRMEMEGDE